MAKSASSYYNYLEDYINKVRSQGRFTFTLPELRSKFSVSDKAINQNLYRLKQKQKIAQIRKSFYAIITPEYSASGMIPPTLFIDDLMKWLNKKYYVGLLSAAALHGAAHQQPMEFFVITESPALRDIKNKKLKLNFFVKKKWQKDDIIQKKTDAGYLNVSSPELTALDLLFYQDSIGINRTVTILRELSGEMKASNLSRTAKNYLQIAVVQRLGYILENEIQNKKLEESVWKILKAKKLFTVPLNNNVKKESPVDDKWKVIRNSEIESDI